MWVVDSTPVECGRSRETALRSDLAGWAEYGYCASHSRYFWGLRLHLLCTLHGLPVGFALTGAKADERQVLLGILAPTRPGRRAARADPHRRQELLRPRLRDHPHQRRRPPAAPRPSRRGRTVQATPIQRYDRTPQPGHTPPGRLCQPCTNMPLP